MAQWAANQWDLNKLLAAQPKPPAANPPPATVPDWMKPQANPGPVAGRPQYGAPANGPMPLEWLSNLLAPRGANLPGQMQPAPGDFPQVAQAYFRPPQPVNAMQPQGAYATPPEKRAGELRMKYPTLASLAAEQPRPYVNQPGENREAGPVRPAAVRGDANATWQQPPGTEERASWEKRDVKTADGTWVFAWYPDKGNFGWKLVPNATAPGGGGGGSGYGYGRAYGGGGGGYNYTASKQPPNWYNALVNWDFGA